MHKIITDFKRPSADVVAAVSKLHTGVAGFEAGPRCIMHSDIKPLDSRWRICGPAFTVRPENWDDRLSSELAPKYSKPGDVLVIDAGARTETGVWGLSMSINANLAGAAGVVIDGSCTNAALLTRERPQIPLFSRGISPSAKRDGNGPGSLNVPVICGGVIVSPGDIILGDADGVIVITQEQAERVIAIAQEYSTSSRAAHADKIPYYEQKGSEEKMRAFDNVKWEDG